VSGKRADSLLSWMFFIERFTLSRAWTDLTDEEMFWEPASGSWSVRRREDCRTSTPFGSGDWVVDFDAGRSAARWTEPLTTVAWLMWHIGSMPGRAAQLDFLGGSATAESGWTSPYSVEHPVFTTAGDAVGAMRDGWGSLGEALREASDEQLERQMRFWGYGGQPGPAAAGHQIIASVLNEVSHHATQVGVLRDLYRLDRR
jgi:hypothetical protein